MNSLVDGLPPGVKGSKKRCRPGETGRRLVRTFKAEKQVHILETLSEAKQGRACLLTD